MFVTDREKTFLHPCTINPTETEKGKGIEVGREKQRKSRKVWEKGRRKKIK